jgi:hypothetical protein
VIFYLPYGQLKFNTTVIKNYTKIKLLNAFEFIIKHFSKAVLIFLLLKILKYTKQVTVREGKRGTISGVRMKFNVNDQSKRIYKLNSSDALFFVGTFM